MMGHVVASLFTVLCLSQFGWWSAQAKIVEIPLPAPIQYCFDNVNQKGNLSTLVGEKVVWHCIHGSLWSLTRNSTKREVPKLAMKWFADLIHKSYREAEVRSRQRRQAVRGARNRQQRQRRQLRVRKEYRVLTDAERNNWHRALQLLKADRSIPPNRFDALGLMHEYLGERSHDGPNFLLWHRFFLVVAENAFREKVPSVTIPYWDSTLDSGLSDPRSSIMWSPQFMGNGNGRIRNGPLANWHTPYGPLMRNFGNGGTMMNWTSLRDTFSKNHFQDISYPHGDSKSNLEDHHGEPHLWVGGYMAPVALAGYDPAFLMHHSFIDLVWELFRRIQRRRGVDPTTDYPRDVTGAPPGQGYNDPSGFGTLLNRHALSDIFTSEMYTYQLPPTCSRERPTCGSPYIRCDTSKSRPRCISASVFDTPADQVFDIDAIGNRRKRRAVGLNLMSNDSNVSNYINALQTATDLKCTPESVNDHYVNNFILNGAVDVDGWSYIPVNVIVKQKSFSFEKVSSLSPATYGKCQDGRRVPYRVFVESVGLSYQGFYKEIAHVVENIPASSTVSYIGIKTPSDSPIDVAIAAYDSCGRICRPFCKSLPGGQYRPCAGALRVGKDLPKQYSRSASSMTSLLWRENRMGLPVLDETQLFITVVCDENIIWPWIE